MGARSLAFVCGLAATGWSGLAAQGRPLNVQGRQNLDFGVLIPGVATTVSRLDAAAAGWFIVRGARDAETLLELTLPTALTGPGGSVTLTFGPADGGHGPTSAIGASQPFDPRGPLTIILPGNGTYYVWLGGTATPVVQQVPGTYTATIVLTATYTGN
jgi:hypothetical protein